MWTKDVVLDTKAVKRIEEKARDSRAKGHTVLHKRKLQRLVFANTEADRLLKNIDLNNNINLIALCLIYWCEGMKNDNGICFTNSDPKLIKAFMVMLQKVFKVDRKRFKISLHLHDYHNKKELLDFWSRTIDLPLDQFNQVYHKQSNHKYTRKGYRGCVRVSYYDAHLARIILSFAKNFIKLYI